MLANNIQELKTIIHSLDLKLEKSVERVMLKLLKRGVEKVTVEEIQEHLRNAVELYGIDEVCAKSDLSYDQIKLILSGIIPKKLVFFLADYLDIEAEQIPCNQRGKTMELEKKQEFSNGHLT